MRYNNGKIIYGKIIIIFAVYGQIIIISAVYGQIIIIFAVYMCRSCYMYMYILKYLK